MSLRAKTLLVIGVTLSGLLGLLYVAANSILLHGFEQLEERDVHTNVQRALDALADDVAGLNTTAGDYATWDDTYTFAVDGNEAYVDANLVDGTFLNLRLNFILIINPAGQVMYGRGFDLQQEAFQPLPASLEPHLQPSEPLLQRVDELSSLNGLLLLPEGPLLVASRPILTSAGTGPIGGTLIMGRYLDAQELVRLADITHLSLVISDYDNPTDLPDLRQQLAEAAQSTETTIIVRALDSDRMAGYSVLNDIYAQPGLVLQVDVPRSIYHQGQASVTFFLGALFLAGLVFGLMIWLLLERLVLSRLGRVSRAVRQIGGGGDLSLRVSLDGKDELADVAAAINGMLRDLAVSNQALRASEEQFRKLAETSAAAIFIIKGTRTCYANSRAEALTGYSQVDLLAKPFQVVVPLDMAQNVLSAQPGLEAPALDASSDGHGHSGGSNGQPLVRDEVQILTSGGQVRWLEVTAGPIEYDGEPAIIATAYDITDRKNATQALATSHAQLSEAYQTLQVNQQKLLLAEKMASLGRLTAGIAHEMNTPLAAVRSAMTHMDKLITEYKASAGDPDITRADHLAIAGEMLAGVRLAETAAERAASFVRGIKAQTRDSGEQPSVRFDALRALEDALLLLGHALAESGHRIAFEHGEGPVFVNGSPGRLGQVVTNLVTNAIEAMPDPGGRVEVRLLQLPGELRLEVGDSGGGIPPDILPHIFEPLFTTKGLANGTGLGLTIVHDIVVGEFGGSIDVDTNVGIGTTIIVHIPLKKEQ